jgi:hypothetical protein
MVDHSAAVSAQLNSGVVDAHHHPSISDGHTHEASPPSHFALFAASGGLCLQEQYSTENSKSVSGSISAKWQNVLHMAELPCEPGAKSLNSVLPSGCSMLILRIWVGNLQRGHIHIC